MEKLLTLDDVADVLGVTYKTARKLCVEGKIEYVKVGREYRFKSRWIEEGVERMQQRRK